MTNYIFIESRDAFESRDLSFVEETSVAMKERGHKVTVFLVQNGVMAARSKVSEPRLSRMVQGGVELLADDFSLCERGIAPGDLAPGIQAATIESLVDRLVLENTRAIWH